MNYGEIKNFDIANGEGVRVSLFVSGCTHHCKNCFNKETWDCNAGQTFDERAKQFIFEQLNKPYIKGLTISGGHPLDACNFEDVLALVKEIKERFPNKDIWIYTGYLYEELYYKDISRILLYTDILVDGPYIEEQRDVSLAFRGSRNQRVINVPETLKQGRVITIQND
jgi:anaerobic ribonucleoside-triphosphate reductase activating protein